MFWTEERKTQVRAAEAKTYELLRELGNGTYKTIHDLSFLEIEGTADCIQADGQQGQYLNVRMYAGDPLNKVWAVAHELGHGVHELYRGSTDTCGESWAEAIRFFAESRFNSTSEWLKSGVRPEYRTVLNTCNWDWDTFKAMLVTRQIPS
jgi:hypothetical protein